MEQPVPAQRTRLKSVAFVDQAAAGALSSDATPHTSGSELQPITLHVTDASPPSTPTNRQVPSASVAQVSDANNNKAAAGHSPLISFVAEDPYLKVSTTEASLSSSVGLASSSLSTSEDPSASTANAAEDDDGGDGLLEFAKEDYDFKINALRTAFSPEMQEIIENFRERQLEEKRKEQEAAEQAQQEQEALLKNLSSKQAVAAAKSQRAQWILKHRDEEIAKKAQERLETNAKKNGVDLQILREIKVAFEEKKASSGGDGVDEEEFLQLFGPNLCRGKSEEETRHWFRAIDQNCSGSIQWEEVSNYLINYSVYAEKCKTKQESHFVSKSIEAKGPRAGRKHHHLPIHKVVYAATLSVFYTCSQDGMVLAWDPVSLRATHVVHKAPEGVWVYQIVFTPSNNRLFVLQSDRCFIVYDCFVHQHELTHELYRVFATMGHTTRTLSDGSTYYEMIDRRKLGHSDSRAIDHAGMLDRVTPNMKPATLLQASADNILCFDHLGSGGFNLSSTGEPVVCGLESGYVEVFNLQLAGATSASAIAPAMRIKAHKASVTAIRYAQELNGIITSSTDGSVAVTDLEIKQVVQRLVPGDPFPRKPQFGFEYQTYHNTLLTWTARTVHVWNALTGARLTFLPDHEAPVIAATINIDRMLAYVLLENKTIYVWDLRNWRRIGDYYDEVPRFSNDTLQFAFWSPQHHYLLTGCSELFALRPRDVQERLDAGLLPSLKGYVGHLHTIRDAKCIDSADHIVAIDTHNIGVWGVQTKKLLAMWKWKDPDDNVTCFATSPDGVRVAIGSESGQLEMYNYACGYRVFSFLHTCKGRPSVNSVIFIEPTGDGPPLCIAAIGSGLFGWIVTRQNEDDLMPHAAFTHPEVDVVSWAVSVLDQRRQLLIASFSNGELRVFSAQSLTPSAMLLIKSPTDRLISPISGMVLSAHSDGTVRCFVYETRSTVLAQVFALHGAFLAEESVTCMATTEDKLVVGDSVGTVSIFSVGRLFDRNLLATEILPFVTDPFFGTRVRHDIIADIDLLAAFDAHASSVTSVNIVNGAIVTSGGDRHLRNWSLQTWTLNEEYGHEVGGTPFHSFHVTKEHYFHVAPLFIANESETGPRKMTRALSYTRRGSMMAEELRRVRLAKLDKEQRREARQKQRQLAELMRLKRLETGEEEVPTQGPTISDESEEEAEQEAQQAVQEERMEEEAEAHRRRFSAVSGAFVLKETQAALRRSNTFAVVEAGGMVLSSNNTPSHSNRVSAVSSNMLSALRVPSVFSGDSSRHTSLSLTPRTQPGSSPSKSPRPGVGGMSSHTNSPTYSMHNLSRNNSTSRPESLVEYGGSGGGAPKANEQQPSSSFGQVGVTPIAHFGKSMALVHKANGLRPTQINATSHKTEGVPHNAQQSQRVIGKNRAFLPPIGGSVSRHSKPHGGAASTLFQLQDGVFVDSQTLSSMALQPLRAPSSDFTTTDGPLQSDSGVVHGVSVPSSSEPHHNLSPHKKRHHRRSSTQAPAMRCASSDHESSEEHHSQPRHMVEDDVKTMLPAVLLGVESIANIPNEVSQMDSVPSYSTGGAAVSPSHPQSRPIPLPFPEIMPLPSVLVREPTQSTLATFLELTEDQKDSSLTTPPNASTRLSSSNVGTTISPLAFCGKKKTKFGSSVLGQSNLSVGANSFGGSLAGGNSHSNLSGATGGSSAVLSPKHQSTRSRLLAKQRLDAANTNHKSTLLCDHPVPNEVELFKLATDRVLKIQTNLTRVIPADNSVQSKLQEVMRIRQERQEANEKPTNPEDMKERGVFYRIPLHSMNASPLLKTVLSSFDKSIM